MSIESLCPQKSDELEEYISGNRMHASSLALQDLSAALPGVIRF